MKKNIVGLLLVLFVPVMGNAAEFSIKGGVYIPKYDVAVSKNGYSIEADASIFEITKGVDVVAGVGYARSGKSTTGLYQRDVFGSTGLRGSYSITKRVFISGEGGVEFHNIKAMKAGVASPVFSNGLSKKNKLAPYLALGANYAITPNMALGVSYKRTFGISDNIDANISAIF